MRNFQVGEEVRYDDEVYVVGSRSEHSPFRYRLLASRPSGTRFIWVDEDELSELDTYLRSRNDTEEY